MTDQFQFPPELIQTLTEASQAEIAGQPWSEEQMADLFARFINHGHPLLTEYTEVTGQPWPEALYASYRELGDIFFALADVLARLEEAAAKGTAAPEDSDDASQDSDDRDF